MSLGKLIDGQPIGDHRDLKQTDRPCFSGERSDLAESWTPVERDDVRLQAAPRRSLASEAAREQARELTSADVKYSIERFLTVKGNPSAYMLRAIDPRRDPGRVHGSSEANLEEGHAQGVFGRMPSGWVPSHFAARSTAVTRLSSSVI